MGSEIVEGQHRAGKHTAKAQAKAKENPRHPKSTKTNPKKGQTGGGVYESKQGKGKIRRLFGL